MEPVVSKKTVPVLSARQLTRAEDTEPSDSWKRFEKRKLERKERSRSKRRSNQVKSPSGSVLTLKSTYQLRICGLMVSKLAQPAELFSHRNPSMMDDGMSETEAECTAFRIWTYSRDSATRILGKQRRIPTHAMDLRTWHAAS